MIDFDTARAAKEARSWQNLQEAIDELATALHRCRIGFHLYPEGISGLPLLPGTIVTGSGASCNLLPSRVMVETFMLRVFGKLSAFVATYLVAG